MPHFSLPQNGYSKGFEPINLYMTDEIEKVLEIIDSYETAHDLDLILEDKTSSFISYLFEMSA